VASSMAWANRTDGTECLASGRGDSEYCEFWSGARDLNPGPHGPEICAVSSTETVFEGFELVPRTHGPIPSRFQPPGSPELLHELLHGKRLRVSARGLAARHEAQRASKYLSNRML